MIDAPAYTTHRGDLHWLRPVLLILILAAFGLRLQELTRQDIWWDEARNIDVALRPFLQIATAPELDIQPPVYYWLLHLWGSLTGLAVGQEPDVLAFFARLVSVSSGVIGVALLYPLGKRAGGPLAGALSVLIGAASPFWLAESQETRMYTLGFALLSAAAIALLKGIQSTRAAPPRPGAFWATYRFHVAFVLLSAAALLTHYNAVFVLVAWYFWWGGWALLQADRWRQLGVVFVTGLVMTLLVAPIAPIALRQIPTYANPNITIPTVADYLGQNWQAYVGGYAADSTMLAGSWTAWLWAVLGIAAVGIAAAVIAHGRRRRSEDAAAGTFSMAGFLFLLAWLCGSLALYYLAVLDRNAFNVRYSSFITPALYALIGLGFATYARWWRPALVVGGALLLIGFWPAVQADLYDRQFDREHIGEVTTWLRANSEDGDLILVDQKYPFGFYYQPYALAATAPFADQGVPARYLFVDINTIDQRLNAWAGKARRVFWVQWFESDTDPRRAVPFLLDKYGTRGGEQNFQGYSIDWWELDPPTAFALAPALTPLQVRFPPAVETVELSLPDTPLEPGTPLPVVIRWQRTSDGSLDRPLKARVALYDANGGRLVQSDERLLNDRHLAPAEWQPADRPLNVYLLQLPDDLAPGDYTIGLLVYDAETLEALTLVDAVGNPAGQEAIVGAIRVQG